MRFTLLALIPLLLPQEKPTWPQIVERGRKNLEREREIRAAIPREGFDPSALAKSLDGDPAKSAEFVRTRIAIEPTRGFVKGAQGALVSQRAGWADRALLLATLTADKAPSLVKGTLAPGKQPALVVTPAAAPPVTTADVAGRFKVDPARLEKKEKDGVAAAAAFQERLKTRIRRDRDAVAAALQSAGVKPPEAVAAPSDEVWWVRIGDKDYERPEGAEERAVVAPGELPKEDLHTLTVRMTIQQGDAETVVLDVTYRTMDLFGRVLTFSTVAGDNPQKVTKVQSPKPKDHLDLLAATKVFVPLLSGSGPPVSGHPFDLSGNKIAVKNGVIQKVSGALGVFDGLPGGEEAKKELTGARLEVVRTEPGAEPVVVRRDILRKGVKGRQQVFDLLAQRDLLVLPGDLRGDFALDLLLQADIAVKEAVLPKIQPKALFVEKRPARLNARLYEFALARSTDKRTVKGTTLVTFARRIVDGKPATIRAGFDLLSNPATNRSPVAGWAENPALAAGIEDTALEHELHRVPGPHSNTSVQLEQAIAAKQALRVEQAGGRLRVVVPGKTRAWYEIDPATGGCLGYTEEGGGQDMAEYATLLADKLEEIREWQSYADRVNSILECAMNAIDAGDSEASFARCAAGVAIGEAFGWASGGIIDGAAGDNPYARLGGMALGDLMGDAFDAAMGATPLGH